jgi:8-amino-7-oxononanoate synthase
MAVLQERLDDLKRRGLARTLRSAGPSAGVRIVVDGRECLLMASNDYLGLAGHPLLARVAAEAALNHGVGSGASRLVSGTLDCHTALEKRLAAFKGTPAALYLATGYMTNLAAIAGLAGPGDLVVSDELNHASIIDACRLSRARVLVYPHGDAEAAGRLLARKAGGIKLLASDGVFSMDGDLAPVPDLLATARQAGALLVLDDAHGAGVWGRTGRGVLEHFGLEAAPDLVMVGTCSKALGGAGGFVAGAQQVIDTLVHRARPLLYTTAPPPAQAAVVMAALELLDREPWRREKLHRLSARLRRGLEQEGFTVLSREGPIIPVLAGGAARSLSLAQELWRQGVFAPAMRPPTVPQGTSRIRLTVTAAHEDADVDFTIRAFSRAAREVGL